MLFATMKNLDLFWRHSDGPQSFKHSISMQSPVRNHLLGGRRHNLDRRLLISWTHYNPQASAGSYASIPHLRTRPTPGNSIRAKQFACSVNSTASRLLRYQDILARPHTDPVRRSTLGNETLLGKSAEKSRVR